MKKKLPGRAPALYALLLASSVACADPTYQFDIPGSTLDAALRQFASQTGLQIAYFTKIAAGRTAPAVSGTLTAEEALHTLLNASGLTFERIDDGTIAIHGASARPLAAADPIAMQTHPQQYSLRMASSGAAPPEPANVAREPTGSSAAELRDVATLDEVVVTGSHIRGVQNDTAPVMTFDRSYIERSGYSNMMQFVQSLPMNFKGGASGSSEVASFGNASFSGQNLTRGTGFNLRGLGSVSTLTLINGRRVAPSAQGQFVDVSTIPMSAVERVEILTDGASAIYGADAVAGVVNIILRKDFEGAETGVEYGQTTDGVLDEQRISQTVGTHWRSGNALVTGEFYSRDPLDVRDRDFIVDAGALGPTYLLPRRKLGTMLFALDQAVGEKLDLSSTVLYSYEEVDMLSRDADQVTSLTQSPITNQWSASLGAGYDAFADWRLSLDGTLAQVESHTGFDYTDIETQQPVLLIKDYKDRFNTFSLDAKADGSLFTLPGGPVRLAVGVAYREDDLRSTRVRVIPPTGFEVRAIDSRQVKSAFAEVYVPLIGEHQGIAGARRVDLSIAERYDDYSDFGSTSNPKIGIVWTPIDGLDLRAAYSTSFRAPTVAEKSLANRGTQISTGVIDSADGTGVAPIFYLMGSAPLTAEESDNIAVGFTFRPQSLPSAELSVNYFDIDYTNRISVPPYDNGTLSRRADFGELVTDIADDAAAQAYLDQRIAMGDVFLDWEETGAAGVRHALDLRQKNAARTQISGFDITASYTFQHDQDTFGINLNVSHLNEIMTSLTRSTTTFDQIDRYNEPLDWRARAMGTWTRGGLSTTMVVSYSDAYVNDSLLVNEPIDSWTTIDLNLSYDFSGRTPSSFLEGVKVAFSVSNLLDEDPPRATTPSFLDPIGYDVFNADALGRFVSARFTKRW
jgi:iron complex outermembrane recepter protein